MGFNTPNEVVLFYGWWQFTVCMFAFLALMAIWYHIGKKQNDFGQVWLALSILCWSLSGLIEIFSIDGTLSTNIVDGLKSIFSLLNSLFILLALPWFRYLPQPFEQVIKSKFWIYVVGIPLLFALFPTVYKMLTATSTLAIKELDVYYALLTLVFLGYVLWESFLKRRLPLLAGLSMITVGITLLAQIYKLVGEPISLLLFSAIFKTALIMLFFALALSWVRELTETLIPSPETIRIQFIRQKSNGRNRPRVIFEGFPGGKSRIVEMTPSLYQLFNLFVDRKLATDDGWLEIKPKNFEMSKTYDINDHNEIKRLLIMILDGLFGKGNWTKDKHYTPLKDVLFEVSERKIRLHVPKQNLLVDGR